MSNLGSPCEIPAQVRRAMTLVEVLVSLGVIAVLIAILVPAIGGARRAAKEAVERSQQSQCGQILLHYVLDNADSFPSFGKSGTDDGELVFDGRSIIDDYWSSVQYWGMFVWSRGYAGDETLWSSALGTTKPTREQVQTMVLGGESFDWLTYTAFAPPRHWKRGSPQPVEDHQVQRMSLVAHTSEKGILRRFNYVRRDESRVVPESEQSVFVWFADGHNGKFRQGDLRPGVPLRGRVPDPIPVLTTEDGLIGRDL
jgi:prepilin-type N-terminal cleavage/methylation domain-containing protein